MGAGGERLQSCGAWLRACDLWLKTRRHDQRAVRKWEDVDARARREFSGTSSSRATGCTPKGVLDTSHGSDLVSSPRPSLAWTRTGSSFARGQNAGGHSPFARGVIEVSGTARFPVDSMGAEEHFGKRAPATRGVSRADATTRIDSVAIARK